MESQHLSSTGRLCCSWMGCSASFLAAMFGVAALLLTGQVIGQTRIAGKVADRVQAVAGSEQVMGAPSAEERADISVPAPQVEEANLAKPPALLSFSVEAAQNGGESSSQSATQSSSQDSPAATTSTKAAAAKTKPPHRELGIALAALGTTALALGVVAFAASRFSICANQHSGGCQEARDAGLILMPAGGAVAVTGFYLQFHR
jgi:hypothetical protein